MIEDIRDWWYWEADHTSIIVGFVGGCLFTVLAAYIWSMFL